MLQFICGNTIIAILVVLCREYVVRMVYNKHQFLSYNHDKQEFNRVPKLILLEISTVRTKYKRKLFLKHVFQLQIPSRLCRGYKMILDMYF